MKMNRKLIFSVLSAVLLAVFSWYYLNSNDIAKDHIKEPEIAGVNVTISIGIVSEDAVKQIKTFQPTADYLAQKLSSGRNKYEGRVVVAKSVDNISELLKAQEVDFYFDSPFAAVIAVKKSGSVPFLRRWKDGVPEYRSVFIVKKNSSIRTLNDLYGKKIAFEDPGSTSAYFLPKTYLIQKGFNVSEYPGKNNISYVFSGEDENTPIWIIEGKADIGAISNVNYENYPASIKEKITIIDRTKNVSRYVVSYRSGMDPAVVEKVTQILLDMNKDPQGIEILKEFRTEKYDIIQDREAFLDDISRMIDFLD